MDDLIDRLRVRAADPARRMDDSTLESDSTVTLGISELLGKGGGLAASLGRVVEETRAGRPLDPDLRAQVDKLATTMAAPGPPPLPPPATAAWLAVAEAELGFALPDVMRRVYAEVADGGFGPAGGLLPLADVVATYHRYRVDPPMAPEGQTWPSWLLPVIRYDLGVDAVDATTGRVISWDHETLTERSAGPGWRRTFREIASSLEAWLDEWVRARTPTEIRAEHLDSYRLEQERTAMGLPEVRWERVVWAALGSMRTTPRRARVRRPDRTTRGARTVRTRSPRHGPLDGSGQRKAYADSTCSRASSRGPTWAGR